MRKLKRYAKKTVLLLMATGGLQFNPGSGLQISDAIKNNGVYSAIDTTVKNVSRDKIDRVWEDVIDMLEDLFSGSDGNSSSGSRTQD